jgi:hypothetical protein
VGVCLQRQLTSRESISPGQYFADGTQHSIARDGIIYVGCPLCGTVNALPDSHIVEPRSGKVLPAWKCPACSFHDWISLESFYQEPQ